MIWDIVLYWLLLLVWSVWAQGLSWNLISSKPRRTEQTIQVARVEAGWHSIDVELAIARFKMPLGKENEWAECGKCEKMFPKKSVAQHITKCIKEESGTDPDLKTVVNSSFIYKGVLLAKAVKDVTTAS